ncbi:MAG TPA: M23 family metallopeptidase [Xanthobacteraceae bacterium]|nr:M23 family metallopeptidase [Xanthobacteraceae bacterium]
MKPDADPVASRDALHHLADALGEDVVAAPPERLLAEAAEDHGDAHALAAAFDRVSARAARQSVVRRMADHVRTFASSFGLVSWKPVMAATAALAVLVVAGDLYRHVRPSGVADKIASAPAIEDARSAADAPAARGPIASTEKRAADSGNRASPPTGLSYAPSSAATEAPQARTADIGAPAAPGPAAPAASAAQRFAADRTRAAKPATDSQKTMSSRAVVTAAAPPAAEPDQRAAQDPSFGWPLRGRLVAGFGSLSRGAPNKGIDLAAPPGTDVLAADDGIVVHVGRTRRGGNLVLVRHRHGFVTAYGRADKPAVKLGDHVRRGQVIAKSGRGGEGDEPQLHFEIRKGATPVDPAQFLPPG